MKYYALAILLFLLIALGTFAFGQADIHWQDWRPATCAPAHCFCEAQRDGAIRQPVNAYSNLSFVLVGLLVWADFLTRRGGAPANRMQQHTAFPSVYGGSILVIGLGSFFYHASLTFTGQWFDVMGMYLQITFVLLYALARGRDWSGTSFAAAYLISNAALGLGLVVVPQFRREIFGLLVLSALALEVWTVRSKRLKITRTYLWSALLAFVLAYGIWTLDNTGAWCLPTSWLQGHAIWHLLCALAAGLIYLYYRSESTPSVTS
jgi:hypothetical protein